ncbi:MAG: carboxypeptidase regulatory-like domain-containing protein [bacterium]|nr:carboxypeptidase regulatory-like domain-containing protein [bacterium]
MLLLLPLLCLLSLAQAQEPASEDVLRIAGHVAVPAGAPDEELAVVCRGGRFADGARERRVAVEADGSFEAIFAASTLRGRLRLESAHLFLAEQRIRVRAQSELVLRPALGVVAHVLVSTHPGVIASTAQLRLAYTHAGSETELEREVQLAAHTSVRFGPLPAGSSWRVHCAGPSVAPVERTFWVTAEAGGSLELPITAGPGATLVGTVVDASGDPVRARVTVSAGSHTAGPQISDAGGRFRFEGLRPGQVRLVVKRSRYVNAALVLQSVEHGSLHEGLVLRLRPEGHLRGTVVDEHGDPVPGASLSAYPEDREWLRFADPEQTLHTARARGDGTFHISGLREQRYRLAAIGSGETRTLIAELRDLAPDGAPLRVVARAGARLELEVLDAAGGPVEGRVKLRRTGRELPSLEGDWFQRTANVTAGRTTLADLAPGNWLAVVRSDGHAPFHLPLHLHATQTVQHAVRLDALATLRGRILDERGAPIAEADVFLRNEHLELLEDPRPRTRTDTGGRFALDSLAPGEYQLACRRTATGTIGAPVAVRLPHPGELELVDEPRAELVLRLAGGLPPSYDPSSLRRAEKDFFVDFTSLDFTSLDSDSLDSTGSAARLELAPGAWMVHLRSPYLSAPRARVAAARFALSPGARVEAILGAVPGARAWFTGAVRDGEHPVADVALRFVFEDESRAELRTDPDGSFRAELPLDVAGHVNVGTHADSVRIPLRLESPEGRLELDFPSGSVGGLVLGSIDQRPAPGAIVTLERQDDAHPTRRVGCNYDGSFLFRGVNAGPYRLRVGGADATFQRDPRGRTGGVIGVSAESSHVARPTGPGRVICDFTLAENGAWHETVLLEEGLGLRGHITGPGGAAAFGARLTLLDAQGRPHEVDRSAWTGGDGRYRIHGIAPGAYSLVLEQGTQRIVRDVELRARWTELDLVLE